MQQYCYVIQINKLFSSFGEALKMDEPCATNKLSSCSLLNHLFCPCAVAVEYSVYIDLKHSSNIVLSQIEQGFHLGDSSIGNHDVERAQLVDCCRYKAFYLRQF